jgi:hypothetical protein
MFAALRGRAWQSLKSRTQAGSEAQPLLRRSNPPKKQYFLYIFFLFQIYYEKLK